MSNYQWFKLKGKLEQKTYNWYKNYWVKYTNKVSEALKKVQESNPQVLSFYYRVLTTGEIMIIGVAFEDNFPDYGWTNHDEIFNCFVPNRATEEGRSSQKIIDEIGFSPVYFAPVKQALNLPNFWKKPGAERASFPNFFYTPKDGIYLSIDANYALEYLDRRKEIEPVLLVEVQKLMEKVKIEKKIC